MYHTWLWSSLSNCFHIPPILPYVYTSVCQMFLAFSPHVDVRLYNHHYQLCCLRLKVLYWITAIFAFLCLFISCSDTASKQVMRNYCITQHCYLFFLNYLFVSMSANCFVYIGNSRCEANTQRRIETSSALYISVVFMCYVRT